MDNELLYKRITNFLQYFGSTLFVAFLQILLNPYLAENLSPDQYAIIGYYSAFNVLLTPLITFYLINFYIQRYFKVSEDERKHVKDAVIQMLVYFAIGISFLALIFLYIYQHFINKDSEIPFSPYAFLTVLSIPLTGIFSLKLAEYRMMRKPSKFAFLTIAAGVLNVVLAFLLVVSFPLGASGRLSATMLANLTIFIIILYTYRDSITQKIDYKLCKEIIIFCWPLVLAGMLGFFSNGFDKVLLEKIGNLRELGFYTVGAQMAAYLSVFSNAVNSTFQPDIYESYAKKAYKKLAIYVGIIIGSITLFVLAFIIFAPIIIDILTAGRYIDSTSYARIISIATITSAMYYASTQVTIAMGHTKILLYVKIIGSICTILCFNILIPQFEYNGAAWGGVLSFFFFFIINVLLLAFKHKKSKND